MGLFLIWDSFSSGGADPSVTSQSRYLVSVIFSSALSSSCLWLPRDMHVPGSKPQALLKDSHGDKRGTCWHSKGLQQLTELV